MYNIVEDAYAFLMERLRRQQSLTEGGKLRQYSGETVEQLFALIWEQLNVKHHVHNTITTGKETPVRIFSKNGYLDTSVDKHCFINNHFALAIECKTYLDKCYMERASSDFMLLKRVSKTSVPQCIIIALEDGISENSYNYFMDEGHVDEVFFIATGKRNSKVEKRIYNTPERISKQKLNDLITFMEGFFIGNNK